MASSPKYHPHLGSRVGQPLLLTPSLTSRGAIAGWGNHRVGQPCPDPQPHQQRLPGVLWHHLGSSSLTALVWGEVEGARGEGRPICVGACKPLAVRVLELTRASCVFRTHCPTPSRRPKTY